LVSPTLNTYANRRPNPHNRTINTDEEIAEKGFNIGLTNSIRFFGNKDESNEAYPERRYKIFAQNRKIKFEIPALE